MLGPIKRLKNDSIEFNTTYDLETAPGTFHRGRIDEYDYISGQYKCSLLDFKYDQPKWYSLYQIQTSPCEFREGKDNYKMGDFVVFQLEMPYKGRKCRSIWIRGNIIGKYVGSKDVYVVEHVEFNSNTISLVKNKDLRLDFYFFGFFFI